MKVPVNIKLSPIPLMTKLFLIDEAESPNLWIYPLDTMTLGIIQALEDKFHYWWCILFFKLHSALINFTQICTSNSSF